MSVKRLAMMGALVASVVLSVGAVQGFAAGPAIVLRFNDTDTQQSGVGFDPNSRNSLPPLGATLITRVRLQNIGTQFGKPSGSIVGRALLQCTFLSVTPPNFDGICTGIAHVPNGFLTFTGNGAFSNRNVTYYAITGGEGPYANDRGDIKVMGKPNGGSVATVTLTHS